MQNCAVKKGKSLKFLSNFKKMPKKSILAFCEQRYHKTTAYYMQIFSLKITEKRLAGGICLNLLGELKCSQAIRMQKNGKGNVKRGKEGREREQGREDEGKRKGKGEEGSGWEELWTSALLNSSEVQQPTSYQSHSQH